MSANSVEAEIKICKCYWMCRQISIMSEILRNISNIGLTYLLYSSSSSPWYRNVITFGSDPWWNWNSSVQSSTFCDTYSIHSCLRDFTSFKRGILHSVKPGCKWRRRKSSGGYGLWIQFLSSSLNLTSGIWLYRSGVLASDVVRYDQLWPNIF
jgi:hypothetical protein